MTMPSSSQQTPVAASIVEQYRAGHTAALFLDLSSRDELTLTGTDRVRFLSGFCTQKLVDLASGQTCEAFVTNIKGKVLGHIFIHITDDRIVVDATPKANEVLFPHLDRYLITEDVILETTGNSRFLFYLTGPNSEQVLAELFSDWPEEFAVMSNRNLQWSDESLFVSRVDWLNQPGYLISGPLAAAEQCQSRLRAAGVIPGSQDGWNLLRVEAGFPEFDIDFSDQQLAQEVDRTQQAISFTKGCYLGQEPIARIDALGHVNWLVRSFQISEWSGTLADLLGAELFDPQKEPDKARGKITSVAELPESSTGTALIGLGLVRREHSRAGEVMTIRAGENIGKLTVCGNF